LAGQYFTALNHMFGRSIFYCSQSYVWQVDILMLSIICLAGQYFTALNHVWQVNILLLSIMFGRSIFYCSQSYVWQVNILLLSVICLAGQYFTALNHMFGRSVSSFITNHKITYLFSV